MGSLARVLVFNLCNGVTRWPLPLGTIVYGPIRGLPSQARIRLGKRCRLGAGVYLATSRGAEIDVGDDVFINLGVVLVSIDSIVIGDEVSIAEYVTIRDQEHSVAPEGGIRGSGYNSAGVVIGPRCWIGRGAYIGPGVRLGAGCVVGANAVVRAGTYAPGSLVVGVPAVVKGVAHHGASADLDLTVDA